MFDLFPKFPHFSRKNALSSLIRRCVPGKPWGQLQKCLDVLRGATWANFLEWFSCLCLLGFWCSVLCVTFDIWKYLNMLLVTLDSASLMLKSWNSPYLLGVRVIQKWSKMRVVSLKLALTFDRFQRFFRLCKKAELRTPGSSPLPGRWSWHHPLEFFQIASKATTTTTTTTTTNDLTCNPCSDESQFAKDSLFAYWVFRELAGKKQLMCQLGSKEISFNVISRLYPSFTSQKKEHTCDSRKPLQQVPSQPYFQSSIKSFSADSKYQRWAARQRKKVVRSLNAYRELIVGWIKQPKSLMLNNKTSNASRRWSFLPLHVVDYCRCHTITRLTWIPEQHMPFSGINKSTRMKHIYLANSLHADLVFEGY